MHKLGRYLLIGFLFLLLILVRAYASNFFYDPLSNYFKNDYLYKEIPKMNKVLFFRDVFFRYLINSIISIGIIYLFFKKKSYVKFAIGFYTISFLVLAIIFYIILNQEKTDYKMLFYLRRFLIHPLFLLLLLPAFYQKHKSNH
ncbi:MAG TPA: exosortase F system-associated protein [Flavobacteriia bacterium]|nr:exosortase F system-associated protein [Flavobacteriia bacterium]